MKKYLLIIFLLVLYCFAYSQVYQNQSAPFNFVRGIKMDSITVIPRGCDTVAMPRIKWGAPSIGAMYYDTCANTLYVKGTWGWLPVTGGLDSLNFEPVIDSTLTDNYRVLFAVGNRIYGSNKLIYDSINSILRLNFFGTLPAGFNFGVGGRSYFNNVVRLGAVNTVYDTTQYKPLAWGGSGFNDIVRLDRWPASGGGGGADTTGLGALYIRNTTTQEDKRLNVKNARMDSIQASISGGLGLYSLGGTKVAQFGLGSSSVATFHGFAGYDWNRAASYTARSFTDKNYVDSIGNVGWRTNGNSGTNESTNFIGTTDSAQLNFRTNNVNRLLITDSGYIRTLNSTIWRRQDEISETFMRANVGGTVPLPVLSLISKRIDGSVVNNSGPSIIFTNEPVDGGGSSTLLAEIAGVRNGSTTGDVVFRTATSGATTERMRVLNTGQVAIATSAPNTSSQLEIVSTTRGLLIPRLTTTQQNAISSPATGLLLYNTDSTAVGGLMHYTGSAWAKVGGSGGVTGITSLNGLTGPTQTFTTGTTGTDFGISSTGTTHTYNLPTASAVNRGALSTADWTTFNGKQASIDTLTSTLLADVAMTSANTWYSGPSVTLTVGTWLVMSHLTHTGGAAAGNLAVRIFDGSATVASGGNVILANRQSNTLPVAIVNVSSGTTTLTLQANATVATTTIGWRTTHETQEQATRIIAIKIK